jgi:hypothetical protein
MFICPRRQYQHIFLNFVYISLYTSIFFYYYIYKVKDGMKDSMMYPFIIERHWSKRYFFLVLFKTGRCLLVLRMCCGYVPDTLQILVDSLRMLNYWVLIVLLTRRAYRLDHVLWMFLVNINTVVVICTQIHRDTHTNWHTHTHTHTHTTCIPPKLPLFLSLSLSSYTHKLKITTCVVIFLVC